MVAQHFSKQIAVGVSGTVETQSQFFLLRICASCRGVCRSIFFTIEYILTCSWFIETAKMFISVDLPEPEGPIIDIKLPFSICKSIGESTCDQEGPKRNDFVT